MKPQPKPTVITPLAGQNLSPTVKWMPVQKEQATGVIKRSKLDKAAGEKLIRSSAEILGSGVDPQTLKGAATGLVVGYVQSGKTLSFTTVVGLARDNGFPLVIVIAGNKTNLLTQAHKRLATDLDVESGETLPAWLMEKNARAQDAQYEQLIRRAIENWRDKTLDADEKPTVLLTVLKQKDRLNSLTKLLSKLNLAGVPALIVDDEADQASLNMKVNQGNESTIYTCIRRLRDAIPCHTLLQYTATPQAVLLVNIADALSPDFVKVLQPGEGYVGGKDFFAPRSPYIRVIPAADIPPRNVLPVDPPDSLLEAMRVFFVGLAASIVSTTARRSMLIHPARERLVHQNVVRWVTAAKDNWLGVLNLPDTDPDKKELLKEFKAAYDDLARTADLPSFGEVAGKLPRALRTTTIIEFNTRGAPKTPEITWRNAQGWILVGGQAVDRGFTVDSLSVTYMPRGVGVANADALQQRARFFGYAKLKGYFGLCRVYLEQAIKDAFTEYVEHEKIMRGELEKVSASGKSLRSWLRQLILDPALQPCRSSVVSNPFVRRSNQPRWTHQVGARMAQEKLDANRKAMAALLSACELRDDTTFAAKTDGQKHQVDDNVPLARVVEMLADYQLEDDTDLVQIGGLLLTLGIALDRNKNLTAAVYSMRPAEIGKRTISTDDFKQGPTRLASGGYSYPGDEFFKSADKFSIQLHTFDLREKQDGPVVVKAAPLITWHIPRALAKAWLVQLQPGQKRT